MKAQTQKVIAIVGAVVGLIGIGYGFAQKQKMDDISKKLDVAIDDLSKNVDVDITKAAVSKAVEKAVKDQVGEEIKEVSKKAVSEVKSMFHDEASAAIKDLYPDTKIAVEKKVEELIENLNDTKIQKDIVDAAKIQVAKKFDGQLNDILKDFNGQLGTAVKIYSTIANSMSGNNSNGYNPGSFPRFTW